MTGLLIAMPAYGASHPTCTRTQIFQTYTDRAWREFAEANCSHVANPNLYWDTGKAYLRGRIISYVTSYKKHSLTSYIAVSSRLKQYSPRNRDDWHKAKCDFDTWADILELTKHAHVDAHLYKFGNKSGNLLARLCKGPYKPTHITSLQDSPGNIKKTPQEVNKIMESFYSSLYAPDPIDTSIANNFLDKVKLTSVNPSQLQTLNEPISSSEISTAINNIALGKAPGLGKFYKTLYRTVEPILLDVYNHI